MGAPRFIENNSRLIETTLTGATLTTSGENVVYVNTATANPTLTISSADIIQQRFPLYIKDKAGNLSIDNPLTISCESSETIDGQSTYVIDEPYGAVTLSTDGANCFIANATNTATSIPLIPFNAVIGPSASGIIDIVRITTSYLDFTIQYFVTDSVLAINNNDGATTLRINFNLLVHADQNALVHQVPVLATPTPAYPLSPDPSYLTLGSFPTFVIISANGLTTQSYPFNKENMAYRLLMDITESTTSGSGIHIELNAHRGWSGAVFTGWYLPINLPE